jgi:serine/threonine-protein kinase RsbW
MRIPARSEWVRVVRLATAGVAARLGFSYDEVEDLKLAVAEACNNAILHGNASAEKSEQIAPDDAVFVTVRWTILPDRLLVSVSDEGRLSAAGLSLPDPKTLADEPELREGGMGLLLIQTLMDEVELESGPHADTTLHMVKYAPRVSVPSAQRSDSERRSALTAKRDANDRVAPTTHVSTPTGAKR